MNGKCGLNWKYGLNWGELTEDKYLILNGNLLVSAPTTRRRCTYSGLGTYYQYVYPTQTQGSGFYQLRATTDQALQGDVYFHALFYFQGLDLTKYKKVVIKTSNVSATNNGTYIVSVSSGITNELITEGNITTLPVITPTVSLSTSGTIITTEYDISSVTGGYLIMKLSPSFGAPVSMNIVDLYLVEK